MRGSGRAWAMLATAVLASTMMACGQDDAGPRVPLSAGMQEPGLELPAEIQMRLDSGNAAFRARDYDEALRHFTAAAESDPELAAAWYGIGMVQGARGDAEAAEAAMMQVRRLAPDVPLQHPSTGAPPNPHVVPPDHPPIPRY